MKRLENGYINLYGRLPIITPNSITIRPTNGLCNRLTALSSALALGHHLDKQVHLVWMPDDELNAHFDSLFEIMDNRLKIAPSFLTNLARFKRFCSMNPARKRPFEHSLIYGSRVFLVAAAVRTIYPEVFIREMGNIEKFKHNRVYIASNKLFYPTKLANLSYLRPIKPIQAKIDVMKNKIDTNHLIGIHIRRGDYKRRWSNYSPIETFIKQMQQEVDKNSAIQFFVASDSYEDKQHLKRIFDKRVVTYDAYLARTDVQGVQDAVVELYLLGEAKSIIGSLASTYSKQAAMFKNVPLYRVNRDEVHKEELPKYRALSKETY